MPLRTKLMLILAGLTTLSLLTFIFITTQALVGDRVSTIFEDSVNLNRFLMGRFQSELRRIEFSHKELKSSFRPLDNKFNSANFKTDTTDLHCIIAFDKTIAQQTKIYDQMGCEQINLDAVMKSIAPTSSDTQDKYLIQVIRQKEHNYFLYFENSSSVPATAPVFISIHDALPITDIFAKQSYISNYLLSRSGEVIIGPSAASTEASDDLVNSRVLENIKNKDFQQGTFETVGKSGHTLLISYLFVKQSSYFLVSTAEKSLAFRALLPLIIKCVLAFLILVLFSILLSYFVSMKLTAGIENLRDSMKKFGFGELTATANIFTIDEIGELAQYFNDMTSKIRKLIFENEQKVILEKELATAKRVQETLLPANYMKFGDLEIAGYYEPASQCGGDWWYYFQIGTKIYVCIGDVTGHGVPSALLTSAARATISFLQRKVDLTPAEICHSMNIAIHDSSRGELQMTLFAAMIDTEKNEITYSNASHELPMLFPKSEEKLRAKDIEYLSGGHGNRLGENINSQYVEVTKKLNDGDKLFFYTDGVLEIQNKAGIEWPERVFLKSIIKAFTNHQRTLVIIEDFSESLNNYRQESSLQDDVSYFMVSLNS